MQIFRPFVQHEQSARFLDNRRLSKQVLELYQVIRVCLAELKIIDGNTRYLSHPIVKHIYNDGEPYIIDALAFLQICDQEHQRRGGTRSEAFKKDLADLSRLINQHAPAFHSADIPPFFVYGEEKIYGDEAYVRYQQLLEQKWNDDRIAPRCGIGGIK